MAGQALEASVHRRLDAVEAAEQHDLAVEVVGLRAARAPGEALPRRPAAAPLAAAVVERADTPWSGFWREFADSRLALFGLALLLVVVLIAVFAPWIAPQNPYDLTKLDLLDARPSQSRPGQGIVHLRTGATNGDGREVCAFERKILVYARGQGPYDAAGY